MSKEDLAKVEGGINHWYVDKLISRSGSSYKGFNPVAMIIPAQWMAYRKMKLGASLYLATGFIILLSASWTGLPVLFLLETRVFFLLFRIPMGFLGNIFYTIRVSRILQKTKVINDDNTNLYLEKNSGVSLVAASVFMIVELIGIIFIGFYNLPTWDHLYPFLGN